MLPPLMWWNLTYMYLAKSCPVQWLLLVKVIIFVLYIHLRFPLARWERQSLDSYWQFLSKEQYPASRFHFETYAINAQTTAFLESTYGLIPFMHAKKLNYILFSSPVLHLPLQTKYQTIVAGKVFETRMNVARGIA